VLDVSFWAERFAHAGVQGFASFLKSLPFRPKAGRHFVLRKLQDALGAYRDHSVVFGTDHHLDRLAVRAYFLPVFFTARTHGTFLSHSYSPEQKIPNYQDPNTKKVLSKATLTEFFFQNDIL
jgi:hypothetical protein